MPATKSDRIACSYTLVITAVVLLPVLLWRITLLIDPNSYNKLEDIFKMFTFCGSVAMAMIAFVELRRRQLLRPEIVAPYILATLVGFYFLGVIGANTARSWDYGCYEYAARALLKGTDPYGRGYIYPPLTAQVFVGVHEAVKWGATALHLQVSAATRWNAVFYLFQCSQYILLMSSYFLCWRLARRAGWENLHASVLATALYVFNTPLTRSLQENQVNLWVLVAILLALTLVWEKPVLAGLAIALSAHIKLYPAALILPMAAARRARAVLASFAAITGIIFVQCLWGRELWLQYFAYLQSFPPQASLANSSIYNMIAGLFGVAGDWVNIHGPAFRYSVMTASWLAKGGLIAWLGMRFIKRERAWHEGKIDDLRRFYDFSMDALASCLIVSPVVWDHHFVLLMPLALWAIVTRGRLHPWQIGTAVFLMLGLPVLNIFPVTCHRMAGLFLLLYYTPPEASFRGGELQPDPSAAGASILRIFSNERATKSAGV